MGLCVKCKYHEINPSLYRRDGCGKGKFIPSGHYCTHQDNLTTDYVTGIVEPANCYQLNGFEECLLWEEIEEEVIDPTDPSDPVDPSDPSDPSNPTDPADPNDPSGDQNNENSSGSDPDPDNSGSSDPDPSNP